MSTSTSGRPSVLEKPVYVSFYHPINKGLILTLPKNNVLPSTESDFGVHHETALTACQIIACNKPGFLSTSTNRNDVKDQTSPKRHPFLTSARYYYHLHVQPDDTNYCICVDFALWSFPHHNLPPSWVRETPLEDAGFERSNWTAISAGVKERDPRCRISGWIDNKLTAHIVPADQIEWVCYAPLVLPYIITQPVFPDAT